MSDEQPTTEPAYVNLQRTPVIIHDENRVPLTVHPWTDRARRKGTYVVRGAFYQQFVSGSGPLYPFPGHPAELDSAVAQEAARDERHAATIAAQEEQKSAKKLGRLRLAGAVVREGQVLGETREVFVERLRSELAAQGIADGVTFIQAPASVLLTCASVTDDNLAAVREAVREIFPDAPVNRPEESASAKLPDAPALTDLDTTAEDLADETSPDDPDSAAPGEEMSEEAAPEVEEGGEPEVEEESEEELSEVEVPPELEVEAEEEDGDEEGYNTYKRADVEAMTLGQLRGLVEEEEFDISLKMNRASTLAALLSGLEEYEMLED